MYVQLSSEFRRTSCRNSFGKDLASTRFDVVEKSLPTGFISRPRNKTNSLPLARAPMVVVDLTNSLMSSSILSGELLFARINLYLALTIVDRASFIAESRFTCLTPAETLESRIEPDNQITPDERTMVDISTLSANEVLNRLVIVPIVNGFDFLLCIQLRAL